LTILLLFTPGRQEKRMTDKKLDQQAQGTQEEQQVAEQKTSVTSQKDALGDSSLDKVSGGGWPYATTKSGTVTPTI
jgi:hypothetical protein